MIFVVIVVALSLLILTYLCFSFMKTNKKLPLFRKDIQKTTIKMSGIAGTGTGTGTGTGGGGSTKPDHPVISNYYVANGLLDFIVGETITGLSSQTTAKVEDWDYAKKKIGVSQISGTFVEFEIVQGNFSGATWIISAYPIVLDSASHSPSLSESLSRSDSVSPSLSNSESMDAILEIRFVLAIRK